jgi:hypothetical protein
MNTLKVKNIGTCYGNSSLCASYATIDEFVWFSGLFQVNCVVGEVVGWE